MRNEQNKTIGQFEESGVLGKEEEVMLHEWRGYTRERFVGQETKQAKRVFWVGNAAGFDFSVFFFSFFFVSAHQSNLWLPICRLLLHLSISLLPFFGPCEVRASSLCV